MINRTELMTAAWAKYRADRIRFRETDLPFNRKAFGRALSSAWADAKVMAFILMQEAQTAARHAARPAVAAIEHEITSLNMKDFWTVADASRFNSLNASLSQAA